MRLEPVSSPDRPKTPRSTTSELQRAPGKSKVSAAQLRFFSQSGKHLMVLYRSILNLGSRATAFRFSSEGMFDLDSMGVSARTTLSCAPRGNGRTPTEPRRSEPMGCGLCGVSASREGDACALRGEALGGDTRSDMCPPSLPIGAST